MDLGFTSVAASLSARQAPGSLSFNIVLVVVINSSRSCQWTLMKIIKHLFPRLNLWSSPNQTRSPPPLKKKALLIGIRNVRHDTAEITYEQENDERAAEEDVHFAPKRKKKKAQKYRDGRAPEAPEAPELKDPHRDVLEMTQLLIGALYR